jgi:hypothetical protein
VNSHTIFVENSVIKYEEYQDALKSKSGNVTLEFYTSNEQPEYSMSLNTQRILMKFQKSNTPGIEEHWQTTTEEDVSLLSRPVYNYINPEKELESTRLHSRMSKQIFDTASSNFKRTTGISGKEI